MFDYKNILTDQNELIELACKFAIVKHAGQKRKFPEDEDYVTHPLAVGAMLKKVNETEDVIVAGILHDVLEDTDATVYEINYTFGKKITNLVTELTTVKEDKKKVGKRKYLSTAMNNMSQNAFTVKICDRFHNVATLDNPSCTPGFLSWYWKETKYIIDRLDRTLTKKQIVVVNMLSSLLDYYKLIYKLNGSVVIDE